MISMEQNSCYAPQCPRREQCTLWHMALQEIDRDAMLLSLVNPRLIERAGGYDHCPAFYEHKLRRYARGMRWRYGALTGDTQDAIHERLERHFGRSLMARMRRGDEVISPEDQTYIRKLFAEMAPEVEPEFLAYEEHYVKPPRRG